MIDENRCGWRIALSNADGELVRISNDQIRFYLPQDLYAYLDDEAFLALCESKHDSVGGHAMKDVPESTDNATVVPSEYFDQLVAELEEPDEPNERVRKAARKLRNEVQGELEAC